MVLPGILRINSPVILWGIAPGISSRISLQIAPKFHWGLFRNLLFGSLEYFMSNLLKSSGGLFKDHPGCFHAHCSWYCTPLLVYILYGIFTVIPC